MLNSLALVCLVSTFAIFEQMVNAVDDVSTLKYELAGDMLFWTTLYLVKATFLALIRNIFNVSERFRRAWWVVTIYTAISFWPIFLSELWQCGPPSDYATPPCDAAQFNGNELVSVGIRFALHVSTDLMILALPLAQIRTLHMSTIKKVSTAAVFALVIIDIIGAIIKSSATICDLLSSDPNETACGDMLTIWTVCEPAVAVIVCALPAYRAILPASRKRKEQSLIMRRNLAAAGDGTHKLNPVPSADTYPRLSGEPVVAHVV